MTITSLKLVDTALVDDDDDTWVEYCLHCGTLENFGNRLCSAGDDMVA